MITTTIERLEEIETERQAVIGDPKFQAWAKEMNISQSYDNPDSRLKGQEITSQYDYSKYKFNTL